MYKYINNNKGSTLLMVMIVMIAVTLLGMAMISMTVMSTSIKYNDTRVKKSMYYAESGIDQFYALLAKEVDVAITGATADTGDYIENIVKVNAYKSFFDSDITNDGGYDLDGNGSISSDEIFYITVNQANDTNFKNEADRMFKVKFIEHFNSNVTDLKLNAIISSIEGGEPIEMPIDGTNKLAHTGFVNFDITLDLLHDVSPFIPGNLSMSNTYKISDIQSSIIYTGETEKTITTDIEIKVPTMNYPLTVIEENISVVDNPIWQNAIVSGEDVIIKTPTTIIGDLYAYGHYPIPGTVERWEPDKFGGLELNSKLTITGDIVSAANVRALSSGEMLNATKSHIYVDSYMAEVAGSKLFSDTNTNVYTHDDIELNGKSSIVEIKGSYYGYNPGGAIDSKHDNSSCIIINEAEGTKLTIEGNHPGGLLNNEGMGKNGLFIMGTSYINTVSKDEFYKYDAMGVQSSVGEPASNPDWPYQTGESVSIKPNMVVYGANNLTTLDNVYQQNIIGLPFVISDSTGVLKASDKATFFIKSDNQITRRYDGNGLSSTGDSGYTTIDLPTESAANMNVYTLANYYDTGRLVAKADADMIPIDAGSFADKINEDYRFYLNTTTLKDGMDLHASKLVKPFEGSFDKINVVTDTNNDLIDNSAVINISKISTEGWVRDNTKDATEVVYVNDDPLSKVVIGTGGTITSSTNKYQGIIITYGEVEIKGTVDFTGVIIAGKDITITGSGSKYFYNPNESYGTAEFETIRDYLAKLIFKTKSGTNYYLVDIFDNYYDMLTADKDFVKCSTRPTVIAPTGGTNLNDRYADLIDIGKWQVD